MTTKGKETRGDVARAALADAGVAFAAREVDGGIEAWPVLGNGDEATPTRHALRLEDEPAGYVLGAVSGLRGEARAEAIRGAVGVMWMVQALCAEAAGAAA